MTTRDDGPRYEDASVARLSTMYEPERRVTLPSRTNDGGEIIVPYLTWSPGSTEHPCEARLPLESAQSSDDGPLCGRPASDSVHLKLVRGDHHEYLATRAYPGMYLTLDDRLGYNVPTTVTPYEAAALVEFVANAIAIGAGYPSIYYTKRKMPFRG